MLKKVLKVSGIILLVLIVFAIIAPFLFKGKILNMAKVQANKSLNAKVDFKDVDISFFRRFPRVAVGLEDLSIVGLDEFSRDTLIAAKRIDAAVNIMSLIKGDMTINSVTIDEPRIHALVNKAGKANWDITKPDTTTTTTTDTTSFKMKLSKYAINDGYLFYHDASSNMTAEIEHLDHSGSGDFTAEIFALSTKTKAASVYFNYEGIPYFNKAKAIINGDIQVDLKNNKYDFNTEDIALNDLKLSAKGFFQLVNDSTYNMDVAFNAPSTEFKTILSLVPAIYKNDFDKIKTSGSAVLNGFVKGIYSNNKMPSFALNLDVKNGFFQYPDLPKPVKNINVSMKVTNPDGELDNTVVNITKAHMEMADAPFDLRLLLTKPMTAQYIDAAANGKLDLSQVTQFYKLEEGTKLSGLLDANMTAKGSLAAIQKKQFDNFNATGFISLANLIYASTDYPDGINLKTAQLTFNPKNASVNAHGSYQGINFSTNGAVDNPLGYALHNQTLSGSLNFIADKINLNKLMSVAESPTNGNGGKEEAPATNTPPFAVPKNISFTVDAKIGQITYDKVNYDNVNGTVVINDETATLKNVSMNALDGIIVMNGSYSTKNNKLHPEIHFAYDIKNVDIQKAFFAFNTVQKIMPIGQFIGGKISSNFSLNGNLGQNMMPELSTLTGDGNFSLLEGGIKKFAPLDKLSQTLGVKELQDLSLKDLKTHIEFANGKVLTKPFTFKVKDIAMEVGGTHSFDKTIDYVINMKVPRALLGSSANQLVNNLSSQAAQKGVSVNISEFVDLKVLMGGTITSPSIKTDLKNTATSLADDMKQQAKSFVDSTKAAVTKSVKDSLTSVKNVAIAAAKDELKKQLLGQKDSTTSSGNNVQDVKSKAENAAKGVINNLFKKKKDTSN